MSYSNSLSSILVLLYHPFSSLVPSHVLPFPLSAPFLFSSCFFLFVTHPSVLYLSLNLYPHPLLLSLLSSLFFPISLSLFLSFSFFLFIRLSTRKRSIMQELILLRKKKRNENNFFLSIQSFLFSLFT